MASTSFCLEEERCLQTYDTSLPKQSLNFDFIQITQGDCLAEWV
jgi:hypothetical protein